MKRRYRVANAPKGWPKTVPFRIAPQGSDTDYGVGDEFDADLTADQERDNLGSGLLEIVPQTYRVLTDTRVYDTAKGGTFKAALYQENEAALLAGGHIELVQEAAPKTPKEAKE